MIKLLLEIDTSNRKELIEAYELLKILARSDVVVEPVQHKPEPVKEPEPPKVTAPVKAPIVATPVGRMSHAPQAKDCETCGKHFEKPTYVSRKNWEKTRFCSNTCRRTARADGVSGIPKSPIIEVPDSFTFAYCSYNGCSKHERKYVSGTGVSEGRMSFCSMRCRDAYKVEYEPDMVTDDNPFTGET